MEIEDKLLSEIRKWTEKMEKELENIETCGTKGNEILKNIKAYVSDSSHFMEKKDPVRSFEAIIWAWAWLEIGKDMGFLLKEYVRIG